LQAVQTPVFGTQRILPALPGALHLESRIVGKFGLFARNDFAAFRNDIILVFLFFQLFSTLDSLAAFNYEI
jgi:hypothetical protein